MQMDRRNLWWLAFAVAVGAIGVVYPWSKNAATVSGKSREAGRRLKLDWPGEIRQAQSVTMTWPSGAETQFNGPQQLNELADAIAPQGTPVAIIPRDERPWSSAYSLAIQRADGTALRLGVVLEIEGLRYSAADQQWHVDLDGERFEKFLQGVAPGA